MAHEEQNDPVTSRMYQRRPPSCSTADLSERDIKENPVVKEEETNDTEVFEEVVVEVAMPQESHHRLMIIYMSLRSLARRRPKNRIY